VLKEYTPNFWSGRRGHKPFGVVLHIVEGSASSCINWFKNPKSKVSAHYLIKQNGTIIKFVEEENTAWHAGIVNKPTWKLLKAGINPNLYTIGIEHEGWAGDEMSCEQFRASGKLIAEIAKRWNIPLDRNHIIGHKEICRYKTCPGSGILPSNLVCEALKNI